MTDTLSGASQLYFWLLLTHTASGLPRAESFTGQAPFKGRSPARKPLIEAGLIDIEKQPNPETNRLCDYQRISEKGWSWAAEAIQAGVHIESRSPLAVNLSNQLLACLGEVLTRCDLTLGEIMASEGSPAEPTDEVAENIGEPTAPTTESHSLQDRVRQACLDLGDGKKNLPINLSELRKRLTGVSKEELDACLLEMDESGDVVLFRIDDPKELTTEVKAGAIQLNGGIQRHQVLLQR